MKEAIMNRKSVRTYSGELLTENEKLLISGYLAKSENLIGLLGNRIKIELIETAGKLGGKIGTYGKNVDAPAFLITKSYNSKNEMLDLGYVFENLILFIDSIGLNTCWLGGTFDRETLSVNTKLEEGEIIPIIASVGKSLKQPTAQDLEIRKMMSSDSRLDFDKLFFKGDFNSTIKSNELRDKLKYVRLAPSGHNLQPWRIVEDDDGVAHFYISRKPEIAKIGLPYDVQMVDLGIALSHYVIATGKSNVFMDQPDIDMSTNISAYVISVKK